MRSALLASLAAHALLLGGWKASRTYASGVRAASWVEIERGGAPARTKGVVRSTRRHVTSAPAARVATPAGESGAQSAAKSRHALTYLSEVRLRIAAETRYPAGRRVSGTVRLRLAIDARGDLERLEIDRSRGGAAPDLERAALDAARGVAPLPAPPPELMAGQSLTVLVPIQFRP